MKIKIKQVLSMFVAVCITSLSLVSYAASPADGSVTGGTVVNAEFEDVAPGTIAKSKQIGQSNLYCHQGDIEVCTEEGNTYISADCLIQRGYTVGSLNSIKYDNFVMEFSFRVSDSTCQFQSVVRSGSSGTYDLKPFNILSGGKISYLLSASGETVEYDKWYDVAVLCKSTPETDGTYTKTFAVFMKEDGKYVLKSQQSDAKSDPAKNSVNSVGLWISAAKDSEGKVDFDNIRVYTQKYEYDSKFLLEGDKEILAGEVGLETNKYAVNNDLMTIDAPRGLTATQFIDSIMADVTGKIVGVTDADGNETDDIKNGYKFSISSHNDETILEYTFVVKNLAPSVEITDDGKKDIADFKVMIEASDDEKVETIEMFLNGEYAGKATEAADGMYEYLFEEASYIGVYEVRAVAYDSEGESDECTRSFLVTSTKERRTASVDFDDGESKFYESNGFGSGANEKTSYEIKSVDSSYGKSYIATVTEDSGKGSTGPWVALSGKASKKLKISYDMYLDGEGLSTAVFIRDRSGSPEVVNQMPRLKNGDLIYYNGSKEETVNIQSHKWYTVSVLINTLDDTCSFELSDDDGSVFSCSGLPLAKNMNVVTDMRICFGGGADGRIALDNAYVDIFEEMPYIDGVSDDGTEEKEFIDYTSKSIYLKIPTGFEVPGNLSAVKITSTDGEVRIKDFSKSDDGMYLKIMPDYLENQGFEPNTTYDVVLDSEFTLEGSDKNTGYEIKSSFSTSMRDFEVIKANFSNSAGVSFNVKFKNDTTQDAEALLILTSFENGVFSGSSFEKVTVSPGESTHTALIPVKKKGTVVKARIVNTDGLTFTNRIYEYILN